MVVKPQVVKGTIWENVDDSIVKLDSAELETLFKQPTREAQVSTGQTAEKQEVKVKKSLLTSDRLRNVELVLGKIKMSGSALREALLKVDYSQLPQALIEVVKNAAPTGEEIEQFINYNPASLSDLALPDLLYLEICQVPQLNNRILAMQINYVFKDFFEGIKGKAETQNYIHKYKH